VIYPMYKIIEAHWSTNPKDSHSQGDADCTYAVVDEQDKMIEMFTKLEDAKSFLSSFQS